MQEPLEPKENSVTQASKKYLESSHKAVKYLTE